MPLDHAILAFVQFQPMSGYDLKKYFDESVAHFWSATQSHIYKSLEHLQEKGWVEAEFVPQEGRPNRNVYSITPAGAEELHRWLVTPMQLGQVREAWLIQIFFSHFSSNEDIAALFETRMKEIRERLQILRTVAQAAIDQNAAQIGVERASQLWQMTLDYGIAHYEAQLAWLEQTLARVRNLPPLTPPKP
jgi:DNA-binding PadR family transcriptional regulator